MKPSRAVLALLVVAPRPAAAEDDDRRARRAKVAAATRAAAPIALDGRLDDAAWASATWISDFAQKEPAQDAPPTERTELALVFDDDALYVGARMHLAEADALDRPMTRRDDTTGAERIIVSFDPYRSRRNAYSFAVTAAGVRADWIHTDDAEFGRDHSWNPVWRAAVDVGEVAWTAEMRIPFSQLRFPDDPTPVWGVNFNRYVPRRNEDVFWIVVPKERTGWSSYFGELRGLPAGRRRLRLEVLPYLAGELRYASPALFAEGDPFADTATGAADAGVDLKLGVGPSLTLDATINPDFGQVEADPAVVALDAYEVTFPERRPFFVEGAQIFASQPRAYFYSRRIGAPPRVVPDAPWVDQPEAARILGAAKLTGRIAPRTNVGAVAAVTAPTRATVADDAAGPTREELVAPLAGWGVLRLERELDEIASIGGVTFTAVSRDVDGAIAEALPRAAISGGADARLRLDQGRYEVFAAAGGSAVAGRPAAITAIQTSPAHYFQRPDADRDRLDEDATLLTGWHGDLRAARRAGAWRFDAFVGAESPGFELNDVGVLQSADDVEASLRVEHVETAPGRRVHGWSAHLADYEAWNFDGDHKPGFTEAGISITTVSFHELGASVALSRPGLSDDLTRGGPLMGTGWGTGGALRASNRDAGAVSWGGEVGWEYSQTAARGVGGGASLLWRVVDRLRLELSPRARVFSIEQQYVGTVDGRYVFAKLHYREAIAQLRAQLSLSPDLTIDGYAEAFASAGRHDRFGELPAPRARWIDRYEPGMAPPVDDPDFTYLSLRSTLVLRWELRPGSVLFAVWQQDRSRGAPGAARLRDVGDDVFTAPGSQTVALKLSYWWSP